MSDVSKFSLDELSEDEKNLFLGDDDDSSEEENQISHDKEQQASEINSDEQEESDFVNHDEELEGNEEKKDENEEENQSEQRESGAESPNILDNLPDETREKLKQYIRQEKDKLRKNIVRNISSRNQSFNQDDNKSGANSVEDYGPIYHEKIGKWIQPNHPAYASVWLQHQETQAENKKRLASYQQEVLERLSRGYEAYDDFQDSVLYVANNTSKALQNCIEASENSYKLVNYLANHPKECAKLDSLPDSAKGYKLFQLETKIVGGSKPGKKSLDVRYDDSYTPNQGRKKTARKNEVTETNNEDNAGIDTDIVNILNVLQR